jgi:hypothetical protein
MKKFKQQVFLKNGQDTTGLMYQRIVHALQVNFHKYMFVNRKGSSSMDLDTFIRNSVHIDAHFMRALRDQAGHVITVETQQSTTSRNQESVMILAFVHNYSKGVHEGHAISAFKHRDVLYCFNPWGQKVIHTDQRSGQILPDFKVWEVLRKRYRCRAAMVFSGTDYQAQNNKGICVGLAADFGAYMYTHLMLFGDTKLPGPNTAVEQINSLFFSVQYNTFVEKLVASWIGAFRDTAPCPGSNRRVMNRIQSDQVTMGSPNESFERRRKVNVDLFTVMNRLIQKNVEFRQALTGTTSNDPRLSAEARAKVRNALRQANAKLRYVNSNAINANVSRYLSSGNINWAQLRSKNIIMN